MQLLSTITEETGYKYIIDIVDHFSKWNYGCFSEMTPPYPPPISLGNTTVTLQYPLVVTLQYPLVVALQYPLVVTLQYPL